MVLKLKKHLLLHLNWDVLIAVLTILLSFISAHYAFLLLKKKKKEIETLFKNIFPTNTLC